MDFFKDIKPLTKYGPQQVEPKSPEPTTDLMTQQTTSTEIRYTPIGTNTLNQNQQVPFSRIKKSSSQGIWFFAVIAILVFAVVLSLKFAKATVTVTPKLKTVPINETIALSKNTAVLPFETVSVESNLKEKVVFSEEKKEKNEKAKGQVTLYNIESTLTQSLIKTTRLATPSGMVYRLDSAVSIPGYTTIDGKKVPGSIITNVTADKEGEEYNLNDQVILSLPAFANSPKEKTIYAKNNPITGGLKGEYYTTDTPSSLDKDKEVIGQKLQELIKKQIPENFIYVDGLHSINVESNSTLVSKDNNTEKNINGTLDQIVFSRENLEKYITSKYQDLADKRDLDFSQIKGKVISSQKDEDGTQYLVQLTGDIKKELEVKDDDIKIKLAGMKKNAFNAIMSELSDTIASAELKIQPFWISTIPKSFSRINIKYIHDVRK